MLYKLKQRIFLISGNIKIKEKLLISFFIIGIIPLFISAFLTYNFSVKIIEDNMTQMITQELERAGDALSTKISGIINITDQLMQNYDLSESLTLKASNYSVGQQFDDMRKFQVYLKSLQDSQNIYRIRLFISSEIMYSNENFNFFNADSAMEQDWYKQTVKSRGSVYWIPTYNAQYLGVSEKVKVISATRYMVNYRKTGQFAAVACVDVLEKDITEILKKSPVNTGGIVYLMNREGIILTSSDGELLNSNYKNINSEQLPTKEGEWKKVKIDGRQELVAIKEMKATGWRLVAFIPLQKILEPSVKLSNYALLIIVIIGVLSYLVAYFISFLMTRRMNKLMKSMSKAEKGNLENFVEVGGTDEIGEVERNFNRMLGRISKLMDERYRLGQELRNSELRTLQAQINPHFLYNTLDLISWKASRNKPKDIKELVSSLAKFYKLGLSKGHEVIPIIDEVAHVQAYVDIQNKRFDDKIKLIVELEEVVKDYAILKLVLQPIIENSILHGIMEKDEQEGEICISTRLVASQIHIEVRDDGVGMDERTLAKVLSGELGEQCHGFGVKNVNERLKMYYGEEYGMTYRSKKGVGTIVKIIIPANINTELPIL